MNKPITISLLILMSWGLFVPSAFALAPSSSIEEKAFPDLLLKRINPQVPEGMVYVPAEIIPHRFNKYTREFVAIIDDALLREEINAGRILSHDGQVFILMRNPGVDLGRGSEGDRSWSIGPTTIKGGGLNGLQFLEPQGGLRMAISPVDYFGNSDILTGGLMDLETTYTEAWYLRKLYRSYENRPPIVLAKRYGVNIDMLIEPIAEFRPKALPVVVEGQLSPKIQSLIKKYQVQLPKKVDKLIPNNIILIETKALLKFLGMVKRQKKYYPIVYYYRALHNKLRNPRIRKGGLEKKRPFYEYYKYTVRDGRLWKEGREYSEEDANKEIVLGAAARYGTFLYLVHTGLNRLASVFGRWAVVNDPLHSNANPLCVFDYDSFIERYTLKDAYNADDYEALAEIQWVSWGFPVSNDIREQAMSLLEAIARGKGEVFDNKPSIHFVDSAL